MVYGSIACKWTVIEFRFDCICPARAWYQAAAQKFPGGLGSKLCGMFLSIYPLVFVHFVRLSAILFIIIYRSQMHAIFHRRLIHAINFSSKSVWNGPHLFWIYDLWPELYTVFAQALLNVPGEEEKPVDPSTKQEQETPAESCGCNKPCNCSKAATGFSELYSTGTSQPPHRFPMLKARFTWIHVCERKWTK